MWTREVISGFVQAFLLTCGLSTAISFLPSIRQRRFTKLGVELLKSIYVFSIIGMMCGLIVHIQPKDSQLGFVIFGLGSLMRFRTDLDDASDTGKVMMAALIGLCVGLGLTEFAILAALGVWIVLVTIEQSDTLKMLVVYKETSEISDSLPALYRALGKSGLTITSVLRSESNLEYEFVLRTPRGLPIELAESSILRDVPSQTSGTITFTGPGKLLPPRK